jgi:glycosyltransferase involved in cell wall biosynthesis
MAKLVRYWKSQRTIIRRARASKVDAVILYYVLEPHLDALFVKSLKRAGIPVIVCAHDVIPLHRSHDPLGAWRRVYSAATRLIAFSRSACEELTSRHGIDPQRIETTHLGVDHWQDATICTRAEARSRLDLKPEPPMILCFGQIKRNKSLDVLLSAFEILLRSHANARLFVVGRPWHLDISPILKRSLGPEFGGQVEFRTSWVASEEVPLWFQASDVLVLPYRRLYQSDVLARACAHAKPVVATAVGNSPEVLTDGETGWIVPPEDPMALAAALKEALDNPSEAQRRGRAAQADLMERFSWRLTADVLERALLALRQTT